MQDKPLKEFYILDVKVSAIDMNDACSLVEDAILKRQKKYMCVCPVSVIMECQKDRKVLESVNRADLVTPDGMPVVWIGRLHGYSNIRRVYGPELMEKMCEISEKKDFKNYFYGSSAEVLNKLKEELIKKYPDLIIAGVYSPPFRQLTKEEDEKIVADINSCNPDIVWVGLGSPKQDLWMYEHRMRINAPVMVGVGAAFDFLAGTKPQAPTWLRKAGLEWSYRLITEPGRLWRRYLIGNTIFMGLVLEELIFNKLKNKKKLKVKHNN